VTPVVRGIGSAVAAAAILVFASAGCVRDAPPDASTPPHEAGMARSVEPAVQERDGRYRWARFERCLAEDGKTERDFLVHAAAPSEAMSADDFLEAAQRAAFAEQCGLLASEPRLTTCREIGSPRRDVDFEVGLDWTDGAFRSRVVEVARAGGLVPTASEGGQRCAEDSQRRVHCAHAPSGTAVVGTLGQVVCARGQCARTPRGDWRCSRAAGGWAEPSGRGVDCELGCYSPSANECTAL
jgi:hypothetical protein